MRNTGKKVPPHALLEDGDEQGPLTIRRPLASLGWKVHSLGEEVQSLIGCRGALRLSFADLLDLVFLDFGLPDGTNLDRPSAAE